ESTDYGYVVVSEDPDMEEWKELKTIKGKSDGWEQAEIDLSKYSGQTIYIGFKVRSDYFWESDGWYLDDIALTDESMEAADIPISLFDQTVQQDNESGEPNKPHMQPLKANVTVLETGRSVMSDPATGEYTMNHKVGEYTLRADAYGYESKEEVVHVKSEGMEAVDFTLDELPQGTLTGEVYNEETGETIKDATLYLVEDANVAPVTTDENGAYELTAYEGAYTLKIIAKGYYNKEMQITIDGDGTQDIAMEPFYTIPGGEIGYDDGEADNAREFYDAGNAWAVKMSLPDDKDSAVLTGGVFKFWDDDFPNPGGTEFAVEVWDANGENGLRGEKLIGPIE